MAPVALAFAVLDLGGSATGVIAEAVGELRWLVVVGLVMAVTSLAAATLPGVRRVERQT